MSIESDPTPSQSSPEPNPHVDSTIVPNAAAKEQEAAGAKKQSAGDLDATVLPNSHSGDDATIPLGKKSSASHEISQGASSISARLERIGDCKVEKRLGVGGFGEVWLATQESDLLKRRVAIKLLKRGMDSDSVLGRFELERKVLSTLNHPNIARLLGGGITEDGRSYFIMEFVEGLTLDVWCKRQNLSVSERITIFRQVCSAVAHAHSMGIVHRDLKPANVIVGPDGVPKLLDFGIAKIINPEVSEEERAQTLPGEVGPLTPMYASPEQLRGEPLAPSTDIYSLGVILYETLTEQVPFNFANLPFDEIRRKVCETEPPLPSNALTQITVALTTNKVDGLPVAKTTTPEGGKDRLRRRLRGDLDNIVLMAMRKEPGRRYATVSALIADLDAHAASMPVSARPNSAGYVAQKWMGRNRFKVLLTLAATAALVAGVAWYFYAAKASIANKIASEKQVQVDANRQLVKQRFEELGANFSKDPEKTLPILNDYEAQLRDDLKRNPNAVEKMRIFRGVLSRKSIIYNKNKNVKDGLVCSAEQIEVAKNIFSLTKTDADQQQIAVALQARGDIFMAGNDFAAARKVFEENLQVRKAIADARPDDLDAARAMSKALVRMRDLFVEDGKPADALESSLQLMNLRATILKRARGSDPKKVFTVEGEWLFACQCHIDDLQKLDRLEEAEAEIGQYLSSVKQRVLTKDSAETQNELYFGESILCTIALDNQDFKKSLAAANRMVKAAEASVQLSNNDSRSLEYFVDAGGAKSNTLAEMGDGESSLEVIQSTVSSAKRYRANANKQIKGEAIVGDRQLMVAAYEIRALRMLNRSDEARALVKVALALAALPSEGTSWFGAQAVLYSQAALVEEQSDEALRLAKLGVVQSLKTNDPMSELQAREALVQVLRKFGASEEVKDAVTKATELSMRINRARAKAILKRIEEGKVPPANPAPVPPAIPQAGAKVPPANEPLPR